MSKELWSVMYHYTRDLNNSRYPKIKGMDKKIFVQQLDYFKENFNVVTMEQVIEAWNSPNGELPDKAILITFDDGYIDNFLTAFPLLKERDMQGSFFIPGKTITENVLLDVNKIHFILASARIDDLVQDLKNELQFYRGREFDFPSTEELWEKYAVPNRFDKAETIFVKRILQTVLPEDLRVIIASNLFAKYVGIDEGKFARELYMNREQIRLMQRDGMYIGLHGYDHYWMANLTPEKLATDTEQMLDTMSEFVDAKKWVLNYPYGNYSNSVIDYLESKGCVLGMTCEAKVGKIGIDSRFEIPRMDCNDYPPVIKDFMTD